MKPLCVTCGSPFAPARRKAGYHLCMPCGEDRAQNDRRGWTVVQEYGKGPYQFITHHAAPRTLRETNQKQTRSE